MVNWDVNFSTLRSDKYVPQFVIFYERISMQVFLHMPYD